MRHMIDPDTALRLVIDAATPLDPVPLPIEQSVGLTLAEPVVADRDYPPFNRAMMDGYALRCEDAGKTLPVAGEIAAGDSCPVEIPRGTVLEIMTGAPCPAGAEAVVQKELVTANGDMVTLPGAIQRGQNIAPLGSECRQGTVVLQPGETVTPLGLANMATFGMDTVRVIPRPDLAIITTGDEVAPRGAPPGPSQIRNSNGPMLDAMARALGLREITRRHAPDTPDGLATCLDSVSSVSVIALTGAVSAGKYDLVPDALRRFGAAIVFHKVTQRPGKPVLFATRRRQLIFGLPGNPLSCHLGFHRYLTPAIRGLMGGKTSNSVYEGRLADSINIKGLRTVFQLARATCGVRGWEVVPLKGKGSADMHSVASANALVRFEPNRGELPPGTRVQFELLQQ